ncbi:MAG: 2-oxo acid dehydrogenase subunit E2 [Chloroflexota bacterium]|nr:2-oxo acid dehydrogenase subunit E2 [Chloroflexota bacterium]
MAHAATATTITMPQLGESVTEGTVGNWLKQIGDRVGKYDPLVEVETDKVQTEIPSPVAGVLVEILVEPTTTVAVGTGICRIDPGGDVVSAEPPATADTAPAANQPGPNGQIELLRTRSSPVVRRIAEEHRIELHAVTGSGIGGRVTKQDILAHIAASDAVSPPADETAPMPAPVKPMQFRQVADATQASPGRLPVFPGDEIVPLTMMRRQIAERMTRSERTAPHVTTVMEVDMTAVVAFRTARREAFRRQEGVELTYLPFAIQAVAHALRQHPRLNAVWDEDRIIHRRAINIGVAVALDDGLIVPVIRDADRLSLAGLAHAIADLTTRARAGQLTPDDVAGGTFTVNNPGTFGSVVSTPILVQPQAAILSTEAIIKRPVVIDDMIAIRSMMNLSLSIDHRLLDGLAAARFLRQVKDSLEAVPEQVPLD